MASIKIPHSVRASIERHAEAVYPTEGCGVLLGRIAADGDWIVQSVEPVANVAPDGGRDRYELDPRVYSNIEKRLHAAGGIQSVLGFFHSHPDGLPTPSSVDLDAALALFAFARERYLYAIQTAADGKAGALSVWRLSGSFQSFEKLSVEDA